MTNLERFHAAAVALSARESRIVADYMLGALATEVDSQTFKDCLTAALKFASDGAS